MAESYVIQSENLTKVYGKHRGIQNIDLVVREGEIFGFLGPNGAGKTTTIRILLDMLRATSGSASIFGMDTQKDSIAIRKRLGNLPGEVALYDSLRGNELLNLLGNFRGGNGTKRLKALAERFDLDLTRTIREYSKGMKQKLAIIQCFMHDPELFLLDEPTSGLDPLMQRQFYGLLKEEQDRGKTVFLSSHLLDEVERLCDRVGIVKEGRLVMTERLSVLKSRKVRKLNLRFSEDAVINDLSLPGAELIYQQSGEAEFIVTGEIRPLLEAVAALPIQDLSFPEPTLEEAFMEFYESPSEGVMR